MKLTPHRRKRFLQVLADTCNVTAACQQAKLSRSQVYGLRGRDAAFRQAMEEAIEAAADALEAEARRRAVDGVEQPVFFQGEQCGASRRYSDSLLMFLLRAHRPAKFRERPPPSPDDDGAAQEAAREELARQLERLAAPPGPDDPDPS
jgi:hypothetical protein